MASEINNGQFYTLQKQVLLIIGLGILVLYVIFTVNRPPQPINPEVLEKQGFKFVAEPNDHQSSLQNFSLKTLNSTASIECSLENITRAAEMNETFQNVGDTTFVYSAYCDRRQDVIRNFGLIPQKPSLKLYCVMWYNVAEKPVLVPAIFKPLAHYTGWDLQPAAIDCSKNDYGTTLPFTCPEYVSFTFEKCGTGTNGTLKVEDMQLRTKQYTFTICIHGAITGPYPDAAHFVEHVELHKMLGVERYVLYDHSMHHYLNPFINHYVSNNEMEIHKWHTPGGLKTGYRGQHVLINDCIYRYMYKTQYLALLDLDEFIIPAQNSSWETMLERSHCFNHSEAQFRNMFFHTEIKSQADFNINDTHGKPHSLVTLSTILRDRNAKKCGARSKLIIRPELVWLGNVHSVKEAMGSHCCVDPNVGLLYHYRTLRKRNKAQLAILVYDNSTFRFKEQLADSVTKIFQVVAPD